LNPGAEQALGADLGVGAGALGVGEAAPGDPPAWNIKELGHVSLLG